MSRLLCDTTLRYSVGQKGIEGFARQPYAGKLHVRFDEGVGVPDNKGRPALLVSEKHVALVLDNVRNKC